MQPPPLKPWCESPEKLNLFCLIATKLACRNDGKFDHEVCNGNVSWLLLYCLCEDLLEVGSLEKGTLMFG